MGNHLQLIPGNGGSVVPRAWAREGAREGGEGEGMWSTEAGGPSLWWANGVTDCAAREVAPVPLGRGSSHERGGRVGGAAVGRTGATPGVLCRA